MSAPSKSMKIAALNDAFRSLPSLSGISGTVFVTSGINALSEKSRVEVTEAVMNFHDFNCDNDPYGEHDFGVIDHPIAGKVFWKIDYYADDKCQFGSEYPEDPKRSFRVLTIMLASEY